MYSQVSSVFVSVANNRAAYTELEADFKALFAWVKKIVNLLDGFRKFDPILVPIVSCYPVLFSAHKTPSR